MKFVQIKLLTNWDQTKLNHVLSHLCIYSYVVTVATVEKEALNGKHNCHL